MHPDQRWLPGPRKQRTRSGLKSLVPGALMGPEGQTGQTRGPNSIWMENGGASQERRGQREEGRETDRERERDRERENVRGPPRRARARPRSYSGVWAPTCGSPPPTCCWEPAVYWAPRCREKRGFGPGWRGEGWGPGGYCPPRPWDSHLNASAPSRPGGPAQTPEKGRGGGQRKPSVGLEWQARHSLGLAVYRGARAGGRGGWYRVWH